MNDGDLAGFGRLDEFRVTAGIRVLDERLFVIVVGKHTVVYIGALVLTKARHK